MHPWLRLWFCRQFSAMNERLPVIVVREMKRFAGTQQSNYARIGVQRIFADT
jgi:hypothetical protein